MDFRILCFLCCPGFLFGLVGCRGRIDLPFADDQVLVAVTITGAGVARIVSDPPGIDCGTACEATFDSGSDVRLLVTPSAGTAFVEWRAGCSGIDPDCTLALAAGTTHAATARLARSGTSVWVRALGGTLRDQPFGISTDASGEGYVTGAFSSVDAKFGDATGCFQSAAGGYDVFLSRHARSNGDCAWSARFGGSQDDRGLAVAYWEARESIVAAGDFQGSGSFGGSVLAADGGGDGFLALVSATSGAVTNAFSIGGTASADRTRAVAVVAGGVVAGYEDDIGTQLEAAWLAGWPDAPAGDLATGTGNQFVKGIAALGIGFVLCGDTPAAVTFPGAGATDFAGGTDAFVARLTTAGTSAWARGIGGAGADTCRGLAIADAEIVVVGTFTADFSIDGLPVAKVGADAGEDFFVITLDAEGTASRALAFGGTGLQRIEFMAVGSDRSIWISGTYDTSFAIGPFVLPPVLGTAAFLARLDSSGQPTFARVFSIGGMDTGGPVAVDRRGFGWVTAKISGTGTIDGIPVGHGEDDALLLLVAP